MKAISIFLLILFTWISVCYAQNTSFSVSGYVQDISSGERLPGAVIYCPNTSKGTQTNPYGFFTLFLSAESKGIEVSHIGFQSQWIEFNQKHDTSFIVSLAPKDVELGEIVVSAQRETTLIKRMGQHQLASSQIEKIPMVLGEPDLLKAYQMMPGVQSGIEGTSGMVVRGSDPGQNLILLDGVPVYNANHLFGLFSVFDNDAIKSSTLIKGAFPARYGGRVSSVLDVRMKEGNNQQLKGVASIGLISSKIMLEGPIVKEKTSFMVSARRTYLDLLSIPYQRIVSGKNALWKYSFQDINLKINHIINPNNRLFLSFYNGKDEYSYKGKISDIGGKNVTEEKNGFNWGNLTSTLRWNWQPGRRFFCNTTLIYSDYAFNTNKYTKVSEQIDTTINSSVLDLKFRSGIKDYGISVDFDYVPAQSHQLRFGALFTHHKFFPGVNIVDFNSFGSLLEGDTLSNNQTFYNNETALYIEDEWSISPLWVLQAGLRSTAFSTNNKMYFNMEPRFFLKFLPSKNRWVGLAYSRTSQNIHLLTNSSVGFPTDQWVPITEKVKPILAHQANLSYNMEFGTSFSFSTELFYKQMKNVVEYSENANLKKDWQDIIVQGNGTAFGAEFMLSKEKGKLTGWIAYTLSKSDRKFDEINDGISFPYKYDRRHDFKIVMMYPLGKKADLGVNWVITTGNAVTLPTERICSATSLENQYYGYQYSYELYIYDKKNNFRMPTYHRLDVTVNFHKKMKHFNRTLSLGVYNVYAQPNALYYDFFDGKLRSNSFVTLLPSINYILRY